MAIWETMNPTNPVRAAAQGALPLACFAALLAAAWELRDAVHGSLPLLACVAFWTAMRIRRAWSERNELSATVPPGNRGDTPARAPVRAVTIFAGAPVTGYVLFMAAPWPLAARAAVLAMSVLVSAAGTLWWNTRSAATAPSTGNRRPQRTERSGAPSAATATHSMAPPG